MEATGIDERIEKMREELNAASNTRQYTAVLNEVNSLKDQRKELDEQTLVELSAVEELAEELIACGGAEASGGDQAGISAEAFADAVGELEIGNDAHWTKAGAPDVNALRAQGIQVNAEQRDALWAGFQGKA